MLPGALGRTHYEPAASARAPSIGQLFPHRSGVVAASLCSAWDPGAQSHIPRPVAALSQPFAVSTSGKAALYTPLPLVRTPAPRAEVGPQQPWWVRSRWSIPFLPLSLGILGYSSGSTTLPSPCPEGLISLEAPVRVAGLSCPRPPSLYLCWCLQFGVGSLGRQLRPVLAERCCLSLCGWTGPSLAHRGHCDVRLPLPNSILFIKLDLKPGVSTGVLAEAGEPALPLLTLRDSGQECTQQNTSEAWGQQVIQDPTA